MVPIGSRVSGATRGYLLRSDQDRSTATRFGGYFGDHWLSLTTPVDRSYAVLRDYGLSLRQ